MNLKRPGAPLKTTIFSLIWLTSCAQSPVVKSHYEVYGVDTEMDMALAKDSKNDMSIHEMCHKKGSCLILTTETYERLRADLIHYRNRAQSCPAK